MIRMGMVGGGPGAFIGPIHRMTAELDGEIRLVAGAFSADEAQSREAGKRYGIVDRRVYRTYDEMFEGEAKRPDRIDSVAIMSGPRS